MTFPTQSIETGGSVYAAGTFKSTAVEGMRIAQDGGFMSFYNTANSTRNGYIQFATNVVNINSQQNNPMAFFTNNNERFRIRADGNVLVGSTGVASSLFETEGAVGMPITITGSNLTLDNTHHTVIINSGSAVITLPSASSVPKRIYKLVNYNAGAVTISTVSRDGSTTTTLPSNAKWTVQSDGSNWYVVED